MLSFLRGLLASLCYSAFVTILVSFNDYGRDWAGKLRFM